MNNVRLICSIDDFKERAIKFLEMDYIEDDLNIVTEEDFIRLKNKLKIWEENLLSFIDSSFEDPVGYFKQKLTIRDPSIYSRVSIIGSNNTFIEKGKKLGDQFLYRKDFLFDFVKILPELDNILDKPNPTFQSQYGPSDLFYLILTKLKILKDGEYYPIDILLEGNGIELKNGVTELNEIIRELLKNGWISEEDKYRGRITLKGEMYLEKQKTTQNKRESILVSNKIDSIIKKLNELGYGQEILFEELEELKGLHIKLNKKNWVQLLKGKLVELTLSKLIDNTALELVSRELLGRDFSKFISL